MALFHGGRRSDWTEIIAHGGAGRALSGPLVRSPISHSRKVRDGRAESWGQKLDAGSLAYRMLGLSPVQCAAFHRQGPMAGEIPSQ